MSTGPETVEACCYDRARVPRRVACSRRRVLTFVCPNEIAVRALSRCQQRGDAVGGPMTVAQHARLANATCGFEARAHAKARSAHAFVRGNTLQFHERLASLHFGRVFRGTAVSTPTDRCRAVGPRMLSRIGGVFNVRDPR